MSDNGIGNTRVSAGATFSNDMGATIFTDRYTTLCEAVGEYNWVVFLACGDCSNEEPMIAQAPADGKNVALVDPKPGAYATSRPSREVTHATLADLLADHPELAPGGTARVVLVLIWPPPQKPEDAGDHPAYGADCNSTFDVEALDELNLFGALLFYSPDGSSGSREFVESDWGSLVSVDVAKYGSGKGLAGQTMTLETRAPGYDGEVGGMGTVQFPPDSMVASVAAGIVNQGLHRHMGRLLKTWDDELTHDEKLLLVLAVQKEVETREQLRAEVARLSGVLGLFGK